VQIAVRVVDLIQCRWWTIDESCWHRLGHGIIHRLQTAWTGSSSRSIISSILFNHLQHRSMTHLADTQTHIHIHTRGWLSTVQWLGHQTYNSMVVSSEFDPRPPHYRSAGTEMGDRLRTGIPPQYVTSHHGQLSLLPSVGREMTTGQSAIMLCG